MPYKLVSEDVIEIHLVSSISLKINKKAILCTMFCVLRHRIVVLKLTLLSSKRRVHTLAHKPFPIRIYFNTDLFTWCGQVDRLRFRFFSGSKGCQIVSLDSHLY